MPWCLAFNEADELSAAFIQPARTLDTHLLHALFEDARCCSLRHRRLRAFGIGDDRPRHAIDAKIVKRWCGYDARTHQYGARVRTVGQLQQTRHGLVRQGGSRTKQEVLMRHYVLARRIRVIARLGRALQDRKTAFGFKSLDEREVAYYAHAFSCAHASVQFEPVIATLPLHLHAGFCRVLGRRISCVQSGHADACFKEVPTSTLGGKVS